MAPSVIAVAVTYNPDADQLTALLDALAPQVDQLLVVDNGSANQGEVRRLVLDEPAAARNVRWLGLDTNLGIAAAQNRGIAWARRQAADFVLLSDQDSLPAPDMVAELLRTFHEAAENPAGAEALAAPVAAVGPVPRDARQAGDEGALVYSFTTWGPKRRTVPGPGEVLEVPFVLASGCLVPMSAFEAVGPLDDKLFIDHVDLAWCLRAVSRGYRVLVSGDATLYHSLGDNVARVRGRKRHVHVHSPIRNYYIMRNTLLLMRAPFLPLAWKLGYLVYMAKYLAYYTLLAPGKRERLPLLGRALSDGVRGRTGPFRAAGN